MHSSPKGRRYLRFWGPNARADVDDEFRFHFETEIEDLVAKGMTPEAARAEATRQFGDVGYYRRYCEQADARRGARARRAHLLDTLWQDIRFTLRSLAAQPAFAAIAIVTLGLGIGANTAIFSVVNGVLLSALPYTDPSRLVVLWETLRDNPQITVSYPDYLDWRARTHTFAGLAIYNGFDSFNFTGTGNPERIHGGLGSGNLFSMLGVQAQRGRVFGAGDDRPAAPPVVVITDKLWQRLFAADPGVIGKSMTLDGTSYAVVGVLPPWFTLAESELWLPLGRFTNTPRFARQNHPGLIGIGRLARGVSIDQMRADLASAARQIETDNPQSNKGIGASGAPLMEVAVGKIKPALLLISGAVLLVLLVACANVANLLLGRAAARQKEFAVRVAIGAGRARLVGQLLTESIILGILGGVLGVALAVAGVKLLVALHPSTIPRLDAIRIDERVLGFALAVSVVTGLLFGLAPALQSARADSVAALSETSRGASSGRTRMRMRAVLTVAEVAMALVLLVGAGLLSRSFVNLITVDPGFDKQHVVAAMIQLPQQRYADDERRRATVEQLLSTIQATPQLRDAALATDLPITSSWQAGMTAEDRPSANPLLPAVVVTPGYFRTMRVPIVDGRGFDASDRAGRPAVVIVSAQAARHLFGIENVVGKRIKFGDAASSSSWLTIVGVVGDVKNMGLENLSVGTVYFPLGQSGMTSGWVVVRSDAPLERIVPTLRRALASIDRELPLSSVQTLGQSIDATVAQPRFSMLMLGIFAGVAVALAAIGLFGVVSYGVVQRSREIGVRIALGAQRGDILRMVVGQGMALTAIGVIFGSLAAAAAGRLLRTHLFGVGPADPLVFASVASVLFAIALVASALPALRATRIDPVEAIRASA